MQLLFTRIEVQPGRRPQIPTRNALSGNQDIGQGATLLTVINTQSYENAYRIEVRCDHPYWQEEWFKLRTLPVAVEPGQSQPTQKDQYGSHDRSVRLFVPSKQSRDIHLLFDLPQTSESRAGLYPLRILIQEEAMGSGGVRQVHTLTASLLVRSFFRWSLETHPKQAKLTWLRRSAPLDVVVKNHGNDWLYCTLTYPEAGNSDEKGLTVQHPFTQRLAVPPPPVDSKDTTTERAVPLRVTTRLSLLRGKPQSLPLTLSAVLLDAPTFPRWRDEATGELNLGAVVYRETTEQQQLLPSNGAVYKPLIPNFDDTIGLVKGLIGSIVALFVAVHVGVFLFENTLRSNISATLSNNHVKAGDWVAVKGNWLPGSRLLIKGDKDAAFAPVDSQMGRMQNGKMSLKPDYRSFQVDESLDGQTVQVEVQRVSFLPWLSPLLPVSMAKPKLVVGTLETKPVETTGTNGGVTSTNGGKTSTNDATNGGKTSTNGGTTGANGGATSANGGTTGVNGGKTSTNNGTMSANGGKTSANGGTTSTNGGKTSANGSTTGGKTGTNGHTNGGRTGTNGHTNGTQTHRDTYAEARARAEKEKEAVMPEYTDLLLGGNSGSLNQSLLGQAIQARALSQTDPTKGIALAQRIYQKANKVGEERAFVLAGTVLMEQDQADAVAHPEKSAQIVAKIQDLCAQFKGKAPDCVLTYTVAATSLHALGRHDLAVAILSEGEQAARDDTKGARITLAQARHDIQDNSGARALLKEALKLYSPLQSNEQVQALIRAVGQ